MDAADDCEDDIKSGSFNPLKEKFRNPDFSTYCQGLLDCTMGEALKSYKQLKIFRFNDILLNVIYDGSLAVTQRVLKKEADVCEESV